MYTYEWPRFKITCDVACLSEGKLLIIKRGIHPGKGQFALPGGNLDPHETLEECARRELYEETGILAEKLTLLDNFDAVYRAPGDRAICCVYFVHFKQMPDVTVGDDALDYAWIHPDEIDTIDFAFDCKLMAQRAFAL